MRFSYHSSYVVHGITFVLPSSPLAALTVGSNPSSTEMNVHLQLTLLRAEGNPPGYIASSPSILNVLSNSTVGPSNCRCLSLVFLSSVEIHFFFNSMPFAWACCI